MTTFQRIRSVLAGLLMILLALLLFLDPEDNFALVAVILSLSLSFRGLRTLFFYFTMARHMVGGKAMLYVGIIILDAGLLTSSMLNTSQLYVMLYLLGIHAFSGAIDILRGLESKRLAAGSWHLKVAHGVVNIAIAVISVIFIRSPATLAYLYALGLFSSALIRIVTAFRKTAVVYIP